MICIVFTYMVHDYEDAVVTNCVILYFGQISDLQSWFIYYNLLKLWFFYFYMRILSVPCRVVLLWHCSCLISFNCHVFSWLTASWQSVTWDRILNLFHNLLILLIYVLDFLYKFVQVRDGTLMPGQCKKHANMKYNNLYLTNYFCQLTAQSSQ